MWVNQPEPKGFGDAVLKAAFIGDEPVFVHAGDTCIISDRNRHLKNLMKIHEELGADMTCLLREVKNPRQYGIAEVEKIKGSTFKVTKVVEKPERPTSNLAIMPIYIFRPIIFKVLKGTSPGKGNEIQLTDGIQKLIDLGLKTHAVKLAPSDTWLDIGTIETYWDALETSYHYAIEGRKWPGKRKGSS